MKRILRAGLLCLACLPLIAPATEAAIAATSRAAAQTLHQLLDGEWQWRLKEFPEMATAVGDHRYDDRLTDSSPAAIAQRRVHHRDFLDALRAIDRASLQGEDVNSLDIFLFDAEIDVEQDRLLTVGRAEDHPFSANDSPLDLNQMSGPQFALLDLPRITPFRTAQDYQRYLTRLAALPRAFAQARELLEAGRRSGWMPPRVAVQRLPEQFAGLLVDDPAQQPLLAPFRAFPDDLEPARAARLAQDGAALMRDQVLPAIRAFRDYLAATWVPAATAGTGATRQLPNGQAWYDLQLRRYTTTTMSVAEIHALGLKEVERIQGELRGVLKDAGFQGSLSDFRSFLLNDARFRYASADDELLAFRDLSKQIDPQLPNLFAELPRLPYGVRPMHAEEGNNAPHYTPGAIDGSRAGYFEANTNNLAGQPSWSIESLFLHETVPGHHLQNARAQELQGLPELRRNYWNSAYGEGWALYAESLGYRLGLYKDPYARFGRLADEALRAVRLVVDTGLHQMGWTRQQAIEYMIEYGQQERGYAEAEVDRYLVWPGQATAYKIGELRILALRQRAEQALGPRFDIRRFHNAVLDHGALPLTVLEASIDRWIAAETQPPAAPPAPPTTPLRTLLDQEWAWRLREFPEGATQLGEHAYDDRLTDRSAPAVAERRRHHLAWRDALRGLDPASLRGEERLSWQIFREDAELAVEIDTLLMASAPDPLTPWSADDSPLAISQMSGPQFDLPQLVRASRFASADDYRHYLARLAALPEHLTQLRAALEAGRQRGWMPPRVAITRLPEQFATLLSVDLERNPLYAPLRSLPSAIDAGQARVLRQEAETLLRGQAIPALQAFRDYLASSWVPAARETTAAKELPGGARWYQLMLQRSNTTHLSPEEIHRIGVQEVARLDEEIGKVMAEVGFHGTRSDFRTLLRTDPRYQFQTAAQELSAFRDLAKRVDPLLPGLFAVLPRVPYGIRPMQAEEGNNAPHYIAGALDGSRAGYFEANLNNLQAWPRWTMEALFLHEAVPGHHLQIARAQELGDLPALRRAYHNSGYIEGWGLYAEGLGKDLGLYTDPYSRFGRLSLEAHRACRLVIDTGLHSLGWTRQQAIDYLIEHANLERGFAEAEIDRYLVWPGQATAYKLGELRILALRARARAALGEGFDLRQFHNAVLDHGVLPLTVLEQVIDEWIAGQRGKPLPRAGLAADAPS